MDQIEYSLIIDSPNIQSEFERIKPQLIEYNSDKFNTNNDKLLKSFYHSRLAIVECLKALDIHLTIFDLEIIDHQYIKGFPDYSISVTHFKDGAAAAICPNGLVRSFAIGVCPKIKELAKGAENIFQNPRDTAPTTSLETWIIKSTCLKSIKNHFINSYPDIELEENQFIIDPYNYFIDGYDLLKFQGLYSLKALNDHYIVLSWHRMGSEVNDTKR